MSRVGTFSLSEKDREIIRKVLKLVEPMSDAMKNMAESGGEEPWLYALPNYAPFNELWLSGQISGKTRNWSFTKAIGQWVLLYNGSSRIAPQEIWDAHRMSPMFHAFGSIIGMVKLKDIHELSNKEKATLTKEFSNGDRRARKLISLGQYGYFAEERHTFPRHIPFTPPRGAIKTFRVPISVVESSLTSWLNASIDPKMIYISEKSFQKIREIESTTYRLTPDQNFSRAILAPNYSIYGGRLIPAILDDNVLQNSVNVNR